MRSDKLNNLPIFNKAEEIYKLTEAIIRTVPDENEFLQETVARFMIEIGRAHV